MALAVALIFVACPGSSTVIWTREYTRYQRQGLTNLHSSQNKKEKGKGSAPPFQRLFTDGLFEGFLRLSRGGTPRRNLRAPCLGFRSYCLGSLRASPGTRLSQLLRTYQLRFRICVSCFLPLLALRALPRVNAGATWLRSTSPKSAAWLDSGGAKIATIKKHRRALLCFTHESALKSTRLTRCF